MLRGWEILDAQRLGDRRRRLASRTASGQSRDRATPAGPPASQGRAIRFLGTVCRPALCETTCPGGHFFYSAKIIPPPHDALEAMAAAAAAACASAAGGAAQSEAGPSEAAARAAPTARDYAVALRQRIELELDLHPRLCAGEAGQLLLLDAEALQVGARARTGSFRPARFPGLASNLGRSSI